MLSSLASVLVTGLLATASSAQETARVVKGPARGGLAFRVMWFEQEDASLPAQLNDATRVLVGPDGYIDSIGKGLDSWSAIDTGVFKMTSDVFSVIDLLTDRLGTEVGISDVVRYFGAVGRPFSTCDVGGAFWSDVDTLEDYKAIESILG